MNFALKNVKALLVETRLPINTEQFLISILIISFLGHTISMVILIYFFRQTKQKLFQEVYIIEVKRSKGEKRERVTTKRKKIARDREE